MKTKKGVNSFDDLFGKDMKDPKFKKEFEKEKAKADEQIKRYKWPELKLEIYKDDWALKFKTNFVFKGRRRDCMSFVQGVLYAVNNGTYMTEGERQRFEELAEKEGWIE